MRLHYDSTSENISEHIDLRSIQIAEEGGILGTVLQSCHRERGIDVVARVYLCRADKNIR